ncbi:MAG: hypothetical protein WCI72_04225 [archaeon]
MEKTHINRSPTIRREQLNFTQALISMLNCRGYLNSQGFGEKIDSSSWDKNYINSISGKVIFPDGSELDSPSFYKTTSTSGRDALLRRAVEKEAKFQRKAVNECESYNRGRVVRSSYGGNGYSFELSVRDTTKEKKILPLKLFVYTPKLFTLEYVLSLVKDVIHDCDLQEFEKYKKGLDSALQQTELLDFVPSATSKNRTSSRDVDVPQTQIDFVNPWDIQIPKLGGKKNE